MSRHAPGRRSLLLGAAATGASCAAAVACSPADSDTRRPPLRQLAQRNGLVFGSSIATWQLDERHRALHAREAGLLFTEDDLLWYQVKPTPGSSLHFRAGDEIVSCAERHRQLTLGAHLVWDEGFGPGWSDADLYGISRAEAEDLLYGVVREELRHYRGRMDAWIVANEVTGPGERDGHGFRTDVPWYRTIGPSYVGDCFHLAADEDPDALRIINEFGFETTNEHGDRPEPRRRAFLDAVDRLLDRGAPVQAVGLQAHLLADGFHAGFDEKAYRAFVQEFADRGLHVLITELDVLERDQRGQVSARDRRVADVYGRFLDVVLDDEAVKAVVVFGLTDRYTWLDEDQPLPDGGHRRPSAFSRGYRPKPAYYAIGDALGRAPWRRPLWRQRD